MGWLTRVIAWIAVIWQRIRPSGGAMPNTITVPLADDAQAATDPEKVLVNALRAAHRVACGVPRVGGGDDISGAVVQIDIALWTSVRPQRIERIREPRSGQG